MVVAMATEEHVAEVTAGVTIRTGFEAKRYEM
jgi:hypothetical protein